MTTLWCVHKILFVQSTEKRLLCLKIQLIQTTILQTAQTITARTIARITARTQALVILTHLAVTQALINQAMLITAAKMLITVQAATIKAQTAVLTQQARTNKY